MRDLYLGIDIGGTATKMGLVDAAGGIVVRRRIETKRHIARRKDLIDALVGGIEALDQEAEALGAGVRGVGIGLPGLIDPRRGLVRLLPNIPGWRSVPLVALLEQRIRRPVVIENDVNLITMAEWRFGAGRGARNLVCLTLGTGVGAGLILEGALYTGGGFAAGELGHMPLNETGPACPCGGTACLERYVGNAALRARAVELFGKAGITLEEVSARARGGDPRALAFWEETAERLGVGLTGVVNLLNPDRIVIGGGVARSRRFLFGPLRRTIRRRAMRVQGGMVRIVGARLGDDAGIVGASVLVRERIGGRGTRRPGGGHG